MTILMHAMKWDFIRQYRYNIVGAAAFVTVVYILLLVGIEWEYKDKLIVFLIFNDPAALGMIFIGSLVLFEKSDQTLEALVVTPIKAWQYLWAKGNSLTFIVLASSLLMAIAGHGWQINYYFFILGIILTSNFYIFLGFIIVSQTKSFNEYILKMALWLVPLSLPFLNFIELTNTYWWYIIPSQASLILLESALGKAHATWEITYSILFLSFCTLISFYFAQRAFLLKKL